LDNGLEEKGMNLNMRKPIVAGNWKMHRTLGEATTLIAKLQSELASFDHSTVDILVCPPFTALHSVCNAIDGGPIGLGAQNMHWEPQGAYTGEISPLMLKELCHYVILGHSERRQFFGETDKGVNTKIRAALEHGLTPIICVGENLEQNQADETVAFVGAQVRAALKDVGREQVAGLVFAYEPIWAIGTGVPATGEGANETIKQAIRRVLADLYGAQAAAQVRIQYGGSVKPANIYEFMHQPEIDGALVGGACLNADSFAGIVRCAIAAKGL
jgi:triosephosphate isomerase